MLRITPAPIRLETENILYFVKGVLNPDIAAEIMKDKGENPAHPVVIRREGEYSSSTALIIYSGF